MDPYRTFLIGFCTGLTTVVAIMKSMLILNIDMWIFLLPVITPAVCAALTSQEDDGKT